MRLAEQQRDADVIESGTGDDLMLTCDETRSARNNRALLLERLCALVVDAKAVPKPRRKTKISRGAIRRRLDDKAHRGEVKKNRRDEE